MTDRIAQTLSKLFERHRIIFWYDTNKDLRNEYESLDLSDIKKLELNNNEFDVKYRLLKKEPKQKFLLYKEGAQPNDLDNWLLDIQLAEIVFRTDQLSISIAELGLGVEFRDVFELHNEFLKSGRRRQTLKAIITQNDMPQQIPLKMLAVCAGSDEPKIDTVTKHLLHDLAVENDDKVKLIKRCGLDSLLWEELDGNYGYKSDEPSIQDFAIELFKSCYAIGVQETCKLTNNAVFLFKRWKDSLRFNQDFEVLSKKSAEVLGIQQDLENRDFRELIDLDYFRLIDQKIITELVNGVVSRTASSKDIANWVRQRKQSHWYTEYKHLYEAIDYAAKFIDVLLVANLSMDNLSDGVEQYARSWFRIDQYYRKFIYHAQESGEETLTRDLVEQIEKLYSNNFLLQLGIQFQSRIDETNTWQVFNITRQDDFFEKEIKPFLRKDNKVCVIISDAMRFEIGDELLSRIRQNDRYTAELNPALSMLPSYTQLGMAALLPHKELTIEKNGSANVLLDGQSTQGTNERNKILKNAMAGRGLSIQYEKFLQLNKDESREILKNNDVIYVYHDQIDKIGDKMNSERHAFKAAEAALDEIDKLVKKLAAANANNILVTADHGFIYQHDTPVESDYVSNDASGEIFHRSRRFVTGMNLHDSPSLKKFTSEQLGLGGELEVQIPKSINRLRLKGSGSRFVHGGASLQEVVIPVLKINKKRQSDVRNVEVEIIRGESFMITSGQLTVIVYQVEPVTDKVQGRELRAGIYTESGNLISDVHKISFDFRSDNPRERELEVNLMLNHEANEVNNQEVILRLEEKHSDTSHYKEYKSLRYKIRRSFISDFDF